METDFSKLTYSRITIGCVMVAAPAVMLALAFLDLHLGLTFNASIAYPTILIACWWVRSYRFLALLTLLALGLSIGVAMQEPTDLRSAIHRVLAGITLLVASGFIAHLLNVWQLNRKDAEQLKRQADDLTAANERLVHREQALEQRSEELRFANNELSRNERTLESLLRLSRSLTAEMSRSATLNRISQTLAEMMGGPGLGVGIKILDGSELKLICHDGFGPDGPQQTSLPFERSFARFVLELNETDYLEDILHQPNVVIPQPLKGEKFRAILSAPLRVNGKAIGAMEAYSLEPRAWNAEQIGMIESLANQTSISLQAAELFERIDQERRRFETIVRALPVGISISDSTGAVISNNPTAVLMLGVPPTHEGREGDPLSQRYFGSAAPINREQLPLGRALRGEETLGQEIDLILPDGKRVTVLAGATPILGTQGNIEGAVCAFADISVAKSLQQELDARRRTAEESTVRKSRFLAQVSHDIRNPVNAISLLAELIFRTASDPKLVREVPALANDLRKNTASLVELVTDILDITRFEVAQLELDEVEFSLSQLLNDECRGYQGLAEEKGLRFKCEGPDDTVVVRTDRVKFSRVLGNLLGNALKFTASGSITVFCTADNGGAWVRVIDTGPGIPADLHERIFDEFFQLRGRDAARGAGLGLAICKRLAEAMGGSISVQSVVGAGSTFTFHLPPSAVISF